MQRDYRLSTIEYCITVSRHWPETAEITGYPTDRQPEPNRSSIVTGLGGESRYYLFEQLLD